MKTLSIIFSAILILIMSSCTKSEYLSEGNFFHLYNDGANMPVWVNGNLNSDVILITVHGGPGDAGMGFSITPGFKKLEKDYMLVYWDQRYSGMTQGHYDRSTMNPDQFIEDTEKLVQLIQHKYPGKKLFMLGHSWGGALSAGYLGRDQHYANFKGWIDLNGALYGELETQLMKNWILDRVPAKLAEPDADTEFWQFIIDWYDENPAPGNYSASEPYWYTSALGGDVYDFEKYTDSFSIPYTDLIFKSMFSYSYYVYSFGDYEDIVKWDNINYTAEVENITIPALLLWGADDGIVPAELADYVYDHLGTDESMKEVVKIPECGHGPFVEHPEIFYNKISKFIETYK